MGQWWGVRTAGWRGQAMSVAGAMLFALFAISLVDCVVTLGFLRHTPLATLSYVFQEQGGGTAIRQLSMTYWDAADPRAALALFVWMMVSQITAATLSFFVARRRAIAAAALAVGLVLACVGERVFSRYAAVSSPFWRATEIWFVLAVALFALAWRTLEENGVITREGVRARFIRALAQLKAHPLAQPANFTFIVAIAVPAAPPRFAWSSA